MLIARCGLQGVAVNDAQISRKHANFIVNRGSATPYDVLSLMECVRERVFRETGVELQEEVVVWK